MYKQQLEHYMADLVERLYALYGTRWDFYQILDRLEKIMAAAAAQRTDFQKKDDEQAADGGADGNSGERWYLKRDAVGMMLYVDLFAENLPGLIERIPYLKELGITYVHLMPLFLCPAGDNDGGYAISSYRKVEPRLGTMQDLKKVASVFHENGIRLVLDFVFNHTSDQHEWAVKAKKGDVKYRNFDYLYKDKAEVDSWNRTLREIFPAVRRGSFTYLKETGCLGMDNVQFIPVGL